MDTAIGNGPSGLLSAQLLNGMTALANKKGEKEKPPKWQLELLMEKLRQKSGQLKSFVDSSKSIRQALTERRCFIDQNDKVGLQKSLDSLQQSIKVNSLQSMVEKLEMVARQLGLKFTPGETGHEWFIHSDMFYLELVIDSGGTVESVKIQHEGKTEQQSCPEIVESLKKTDFLDFTAHLEGLVSIYQLNADKKIKSKAYIALQCLEADLAMMASTYANVNDAELAVLKTLLGVLQPRKGGHPVKLTYFISPYEFLDVNAKSSLSSDVKTVLANKLGNSASIHIQASSSRKLQMSTTVTVQRSPDGKSSPRYGALNALNSTALPACFLLKLDKPLPMCVSLLKSIFKVTEIEAADLSLAQPILNIITHQLSNGTMNCVEKGLFVSLPDQTHCYFMTETNLEGVLLHSISFTLASQLPQIINILRQQMAFNTLVGSCVRMGSKPELDHIVFEVTALSYQKLSVSFQHPLDDSLVTLEFDLRDVTHPHCHLHAVANATDIIPTLEEHACKVVKRSMSIPITLRAVIRRWRSLKVKSEPPNPDFPISVGRSSASSSVPDASRLNDRSCGSESGERRSSQNVLIPPGIMNFGSKASLPIGSAYSLPPVGFPSQSPNPMDILNYMNMNPLLNTSAGINTMAMQMLASQAHMFRGLFDPNGQQPKRRKRKNTSDSNLPSSSPRPSQSPSPSRLPTRSPMRRQSDSSSNDGNVLGLSDLVDTVKSELPDSRWNVDITSMSSADDIDIKTPGKKVPKRSLSLDSHSSEDLASIQQSLLDSQQQDFKGIPFGNQSVSITPVSSSAAANPPPIPSLLAAASARRDFEIIPLSHPLPSIPSCLTVTPLGGTKADGASVKADKPKKSKDRSLSSSSSATGTKRKLDSDGMERPSKLPFIDAKGRISPSLNLSKKPSSPLNIGSPSKLPASQGKPSVTTLKSVSSTPGSPSNPNTKPKPKSKQFNKGFHKTPFGNIPGLKALTASGIPMLLPSKGLDGVGGPSSTTPSSLTLEAGKDIAKSLATIQAGLQQANPSLPGSTSAAASQKPVVQKKKSLDSIIGKLTASSFQGDGEREKKELPSPNSTTTMSAKDYLKVSSAITNDVMQQKKALTAGVAGAGPEYMVKGAGSMKVTLKTKLKDPNRSPKPGGSTLKSPGLGGQKKTMPGLKQVSQLSATLAKFTSGNKKPILGNKDSSKDLGKIGGNMNANAGKGNALKVSEDLTKKLFLPGSVKSLEAFSSAPVFDPNKFQIPKKPKTSSNVSTSSAASDISTKSSSVEREISARTIANSESVPAKEKASSTPIATALTPMDVDTIASDAVQAQEMKRTGPPGLIEVSRIAEEIESNAPVELRRQSSIPDPVESSVAVAPKTADFASPESPDPVNLVVNLSAPQNIPTTPVSQSNCEEGPRTIPTSPVQQQAAASGSTSSTSGDSAAAPAKGVTPPPAPPTVIPTEPEEVDEGQLFIDDGSASKTAEDEKKGTDGEAPSKSPSEMPPPPVPQTDQFLAPAPSPKPVASPVIASVHIVHSPQPNSPVPSSVLLRSPLVQVAASPSSASPYQIDDDLMDEALIGGSNSNK